MRARIEYRPSDTQSDKQIGEVVERTLKRMHKLADD